MQASSGPLVIGLGSIESSTDSMGRNRFRPAAEVAKRLMGEDGLEHLIHILHFWRHAEKEEAGAIEEI
jgi:hypothetical protein